MNEARRLIYEDRNKLSEFDVYKEGTLNNYIYCNWLLSRKELRKVKTDFELGKMMVDVFNDAYYICTIIYMHPHSSRWSRWFIQQTSTPSLVMPLVHLYVEKTGVATREITDLQKLIEGDFDCYPEWKENNNKLIESLNGYNNNLSISTFARRELTPELLSSIRWGGITNLYKEHNVKNLIGFVATNLDEQKQIAKAIFEAIKDFEYENELNYYCDDDGNFIKDSYDFSKTYQLLTEIMDSNKYSYLVNQTSFIDGFMPKISEGNVVRRGRPKMNPNDIQASFVIHQKLDNLNQRLDLFCQTLKEKGFIDNDTDQMVFIDMFKGGAPASKIKWLGAIIELHYLFEKLYNMKLIKNRPTSAGKWQAVCSCFEIRVRKKNGYKKAKEYNIEHVGIRPEQFTKGGKMPESHEELDYIISFLDPKVNYKRALDSFDGNGNEIKNMFDELQVYDERELSRH